MNVTDRQTDGTATAYTPWTRVCWLTCSLVICFVGLSAKEIPVRFTVEHFNQMVGVQRT